MTTDKITCRKCGSHDMTREEVYFTRDRYGIEGWFCNNCNTHFEVEVFYELTPASFGRMRTDDEVENDIWTTPIRPIRGM